MLVADVMTNEGDIRAIGRHGISGKKSGRPDPAAFEITAAHLLKAAITGEVDELKGVAENIIVGDTLELVDLAGDRGLQDGRGDLERRPASTLDLLARDSRGGRSRAISPSFVMTSATSIK